ncbi:hypothetical protein [Microlunatus antarcticus]|uniref:ATP synthase protein I n=1 Tax=Microlunatus antarcticus TaxID=53388 RepID=A0A7W5JW72_9ACTN|nr:hypothetical protein [Microlunatus antarcticus]MBB3327451.1 hypothetical protein [Microlunatus antarcticus]
MTNPRAGRARPRPSVHVERARKLLMGGLLGGVSAAVLSMIGFGIGMGARGLASAALASVMVLFFYSVGQLVMVRFADAGARLLLSVALASYTGRVVVLGLVLLLYARFSDRFPVLPIVVFLSTVAVVVGWLVVEVIVFSRLRISAFDANDADDPAEAPKHETVP